MNSSKQTHIAKSAPDALTRTAPSDQLPFGYQRRDGKILAHGVEAAIVRAAFDCAWAVAK